MTTHPLQDGPLCLKRKDVLRLTGWSKDTYMQMVATGELPVAHRLPRSGQARFSREAVLALLRSAPGQTVLNRPEPS